MRALSRKYPIVDLEEAPREGVMVGHEELQMPRFQRDTAQIEALMTTLESMERKRAPAPTPGGAGAAIDVASCACRLVVKVAGATMRPQKLQAAANHA